MTFRDRLRAGEPLTGVFLKTPSHQVVEVLATTGVDAVVVDTEHAPFDASQLDATLAVAHARGLACLVRVAAAERVLVQQALDGGATGVLVPHVDTAAVARDVVRWSHYGDGGRGYSGSTRSAGWGTRPMRQVLRTAAETTTVVVQIEDPAALDDLDAVVGVAGIDAVFVGAADLTVGLGCDDPADPRVAGAVDAIAAATTRAGVPLAAFAVDAADEAVWRARGASFVISGTDQSRLRRA
jgi:2-keto-3-deoxy-L-rhamnonate aldolase RhmA